MALNGDLKTLRKQHKKAEREKVRIQRSASAVAESRLWQAANTQEMDKLRQQAGSSSRVSVRVLALD